jgi:hypothetical protein
VPDELELIGENLNIYPHQMLPTVAVTEIKQPKAEILLVPQDMQRVTIPFP